MNRVIFLFGLAIVWIIFAVIQDLKKREVANWLNFSLIIFALGFRFFYCLFSSEVNGFAFFYQGLIGLGIFFVIGNLLYYGKMFAGGDAKLMIALGAVLPFSESFFTNMKTFFLFFFLFLFVGAVYILIFSFVLSVRNFKEFRKEFFRQIKKQKKFVCVFGALGIVLIVLSFFINSFFFAFGFLFFALPFFYVYAKAVDESCMIKEISVNKLSEGDWIYKNLRLGKKMIKAKWEGVSKEEIKKIKKKYKKVKVRQGIPFTPAFLISFLILIIFYFLKIDFLNLFG